MPVSSQTILPFWSSFLSVAPMADAAKRPVVALRADEMPDREDSLRLVLDGTRTALLDLLADVEAAGAQPPPCGALGVLEDSQGTPRGVVEFTEVELARFDDIDDGFARAFASWGSSLKAFRRGCRTWFAPRCRALGHSFAPDTVFVCQRIRLVFTPA
jgi:uncharacterized protein YhfF